MSWFDNKELPFEVDVIGWNFLKKKEKILNNLNIDIEKVNEYPKCIYWFEKYF